MGKVELNKNMKGNYFYRKQGYLEYVLTVLASVGDEVKCHEIISFI